MLNIFKVLDFACDILHSCSDADEWTPFFLFVFDLTSDVRDVLREYCNV
jgi:hypothetical protein